MGYHFTAKKSSYVLESTLLRKMLLVDRDDCLSKFKVQPFEKSLAGPHRWWWCRFFDSPLKATKLLEHIQISTTDDLGRSRRRKKSRNVQERRTTNRG